MANQTTPAIQIKDSNVGIGTTTPSFKLQVFDSTNTVVAIQAGNQPSLQLNTTDGLANAELFNSYGNVGLVGNLTSSNYIFYHYGGAGTLANQYTYFQTAGVERMRITGTGNVGIGTTSPDNVLDLGAASQGRALTWDNYSNVFSAYSSGNLVLAQNFYGDTATDTYKTSLTASYGAAGILISGTAAGLNGVMRFYVDNAAAKTAGAAFTPTERMQISGNGAIKFSTYGSGSFTGTVAYNLAVDSSGNIIETAGGVVDGSGTANYVSKWQDANTLTDSQIFDNGTAVGIGVATPQSKLDLQVAPTQSTTSTLGYSANASLNIRIPNSVGDVGQIVFTNASAPTAGYASIGVVMTSGSGVGIGDIIMSTKSIGADAASTERMRITSGGNVGIGTTAPGQKLEVNGTIVAGTYNNTRAEITSNGRVQEFYSTEANPRWAISRDLVDGGKAGIGFNDTVGTIDVTGSAIGGSLLRALGFYTSNGTALVERMRIADGGNVGIGTTSPSYKLDVNGTARVSSNVTVGSRLAMTPSVFGYSNSWKTLILGSTGTDYSTDATTVTFGVDLSANPSGSYTGNGGEAFFRNVFAFGTPNAANNGYLYPMLFNNGEVHFTAGNVGIGTTVPSAKLDVNGDINLTNYGSLTGGNSSNRMAIIKGTGASGNIEIGGLNNNDVIILTHVSERMRITSGGNVGIGTTSPSSPGGFSKILHISGGYASLVLTSTLPNKTWEIGVNASSLLTFYDGVADRMVINTSGNVGIGTTSPSYKLDVNGATQIQNELILSTNDAAFRLYRTTGVNYFDWSSGQDLRFSTVTSIGGAGRSTAVTFLSTGNVGIGTTAPNQRLSVEGGNIQLNANNAAANYYLFLNKKTGQDGGILFNRDNNSDWQLTNGAGNGDLIFYSYGTASEAITFKKGTGNVGIGTTSPAFKLDVSGSGRFSGDINLGSSGEHYLQNDASTTFVGLNFDSPYIRFGVNNTERMRITSGGNVLIGTTADTPLSTARGIVINSGASNDAQIRLQNNTTGSTGSDGALFSLSGTGVYLWNYENDAIFFGTNNSTRITITSSGNVGIGLTNPSYKLDVTGDARINTGSLGVNVAPNATDGRIDASNDIVAFSTSDRRLKENITPIANALEKVRSLTGVEFDWKEETKSVHGYEGHDVGVIAQDVQAVLPEAVRTNDSGYLSVRYEKMIALLVEANKELADRVEQLEKLIK